MIIYHDTEKELFFSEDYKPLPCLENMTYTDIIELLENVVQALYNAIDNGASMLEIALTDDIITINKHRFINYLRFTQSGRIASVISNTKYCEIDKAVSAALQYIEKDNSCLLDIGKDNTGIENIIKTAYQESIMEEGKTE